VALLYHHESTRADPQKLLDWLEAVIKGDELGRLLQGATDDVRYGDKNVAGRPRLTIVAGAPLADVRAGLEELRGRLEEQQRPGC